MKIKLDLAHVISLTLDSVETSMIPGSYSVFSNSLLATLSIELISKTLPDSF